jgi:transcriptional regulator of arginine metabolism
MTTEDLRKPLARRQLIRRLIATGEIHSQEQVVAELAPRDFAELGVVRGVRNGSPVYIASDDLPSSRDPGAVDRLRRLLLDLPLTIDEAPPLLVLRTSPGAANAIARAVDLLPLDGLVGTLAGDDTIFLACRDRDALRRIRAQFEALRAGEEVS